MVTTPIRKKEEIEIMKQYYLETHSYRDYALFVLGINTALRISDLLNLKWENVYNFDSQKYLSHIIITEQKTGKQTCIVINRQCNMALEELRMQSRPKCAREYIFYTKNDRYSHISRNRAYHIIKQAADINKIEGNISCHSLRKTFGYHAWKCGAPSALIMEIYNHSSIEITKKYLSITQDEKDELFNVLNL